jgi:hypothetical protein
MSITNMLAIKAAPRRHDGCANARDNNSNPANATFSHPIFYKTRVRRTFQGPLPPIFPASCPLDLYKPGP